MKGTDLDEIDHSPLKPSERARLRRMLQDDHYARRFKTAVKVWVITLGTVGSFVVAAMTVWREILIRMWK